MFEFLSFGGGVNSTAISLLLRPAVLIFADTGDEHPDTYAYIADRIKPFVASYGGRFVKVGGNGKYQRLQDQAFSEKIIPVRMHRWCTDKFKVRPIRRWLEENDCLPCRQMIGIDAGERHRAKDSGNPSIANVFPLLERDLDRDDCAQVILRHGWPVPRKSGCFYCPFASKRQWVKLKRDHPQLYQIAVRMEQNAQNFAKGMYLAGDAPLDEWLAKGRIRAGDAEQLELAMPCACYDG